MADVFLTGGVGQSTNQPGSPALQSIPELDGTQDGLTATVAALVQTVRALAGQSPAQNNTRGQNGPKPNPKKDDQKPKQNTGRFIETNRQTNSVTVSDPSSGASVTFKQITQLTMQDTVTRETWTWNL